MAEFPVLPLFTDAYLGDTRHLTAAQHGAYLLLMMTAWRTEGCCLPDDDDRLSRWASMDKRTWLKNKSIVMAFWKKDNLQNWVQGRLADERKSVEVRRSKNAEAGKASALKRLGRHSTSVQPKLNQNSTILNPSLNPRNSSKEEFKLPDWIPQEQWEAWLPIRISKKAKNTPYALGLAVKELQKLVNQGENAIEVLNQSIMRGYSGLFPTKKDQQNGQRNHTNQSKPSYFDIIAEGSAIAASYQNND